MADPQPAGRAEPGIVYQVRTTAEHRPVIGLDSCVLRMPPQMYVEVGDGPPAVDVRLLGWELRRISEQSADHLGVVLHHAEWVVTGQADVVKERGLAHDCASCRAAVDQALAALAEHGGEMLVGILYWC